MCTLNESLKSKAESIMTEAYNEALKEKVAMAVASVFSGFRTDLLTAHFEGASDAELKKEISAFNADTRKGSMKVVKGINSRINEKGQLIEKDENGNETVVKGAQVIGVIQSTDKDGNVVKSADVFAFPFIADTVQRNISVICNWLEYRSTIKDSFAYIKQLENEKVEKEIKKLENELLEAAKSKDYAKCAEISEKIESLKK